MVPEGAQLSDADVAEELSFLNLYSDMALLGRGVATVKVGTVNANGMFLAACVGPLIKIFIASKPIHSFVPKSASPLHLYRT